MKINYEYFLRRRKCTSETLIKSNDLNTVKKFKLFLNSINVKAPDDKIYEEAFKNVYETKKDESVEQLLPEPEIKVETVEVQETVEEVTVDIKDDAAKPKKRTRRRSRKKSTTSWILFCFR